MRHSTLMIVLIVICLLPRSYSQDWISLPFNDAEVIPCPFDTSQTIETPDNWFAYQTLNGIWDGTIDSSRCISLRWEGGQFKIVLEEADLNRPVFVRARIDQSNIPLLYSNEIHSAESYYYIGNDSHLKEGTDCPGGLCTGLILGVSVPDSTGNDFETRYYKNSRMADDALSYKPFKVCFPTEKFPENLLSEYIIKFQFEEDDPAAIDLDLYGNDIILTYFTGKVYTIDMANQGPGGVYRFNLGDFSDIGFADNILMMYGNTGYPSMNNPHYIEPTIIPNSTEQETIELYLNDYQFLTFQPFTFLRGSLVEGSNSVRHIVNLTNNGADFCISFIEVSFSHGSNYIHMAGKLSFESDLACMQFSEGSKLIVADNTNLVYGRQGQGILALRSGGSLEIGYNATLTINNVLHIHETRGATKPRQLYMELNEGSTLRFGPQAHITNEYSLDGSMRLNVYMNGGNLDDSNLDAHSRSLINRIYPSKDLTIGELTLYPNPVSTTLQARIDSDVDGQVRARILNAKGQEQHARWLNLQSGQHDYRISVNNLNPGVYWLDLGQAGQSRFVVGQ